MKKGGGSASTIITGPSKAVVVYALHSLEYVQALSDFVLARVRAKIIIIILYFYIFQIFMFLYFYIFIFLYFYIFIFLCFHIFIFLYFYIFIFLYFYIFIFLYYYIITLYSLLWCRR